MSRWNRILYEVSVKGFIMVAVRDLAMGTLQSRTGLTSIYKSNKEPREIALAIK